MTYSEFLNSLITPISTFITWLGLMFNYLITNYFFITLVGITLISSLILYFLSITLFHINSSKDLDNVSNRK